ncbi:recombination inhibitory protein MutS2 [Liquorilactobacillus sucicola DSM 21376 = JCM 15457]|uniref:Endonuclease MutS2 n=1 Tax=Liquorilactobacillus sucicola DSM 21376 = JCM 15457 TaxID=1423806 RepID=A0A023CWM3_9LACO|nr:endonuclease MutS2 [Liquorilactobacillus sucicola]KRN06068.1 DNA mismatch repair protein [Liquorilactobacillus sucicola DSM 21376 = JCM 15457]GAJ25996.1 recombination inhibitory protein MutS2 [Liquorilactobacillus sucicola DSM 21376 = JCM 15457]
MNTKALDVLEYNKVIKKLFQFIVTPMGEKKVRSLQPSNDLSTIQKALAQTKDGADILRLKGGIPLPKLHNIKPYLKRLDIGAALNGKELAAIGRVLRATNEVRRFFITLDDEKVELEELYGLTDDLQVLPEINKRLLTAVETDGHVTDEASSVLRNIRKAIATTENQLRDRLSDFIHGNSAKYLSDAVITIRNDRYVIPVRQEYRNHFGGVVHDQSSSGQTLFVEPKAIVELNNRLKQQQAQEKEEIQRILQELSELIAPYTAELENNADILGTFDFVNAKSKYAAAIKATEPQLSVQNDIYLRQVWHPLLKMEEAVRNDIMLGKDYQAIVITGPNTGGKTITLKTLGLIQMMGQAGLFIPAFEGSRIGIFNEIFADIGDEQSIEQNLSTFSSHMTNIVSILEKIDEHSLVLFDELGAGTDPQEGAALAIAILDAVGAKGSYVLATTHYPELKAYGFDRPQTINASMEFDVDTLQPTYRLLIGIPGRSNALDISQRLGLDKQIINQARQLTRSDSQDLNNMIQDLVQKRRMAEEEHISLQQNLRDAEKLHADLEKEYQKFDSKRDDLLEKAKIKANSIVETATQESDKLIGELRQMRLNAGSQVKENELIDAKTKMNQLHQPTNLRKNKVLQRAKRQQEFHSNDDVMVKSYGQQGVLLQKLSKNEWEVQLGILKMRISENDLEKIRVKDNKTKGTRSTLKTARQSHVSPRLDLRGQRYEEALTNVDRYMDAAILAGYASVTIVHGKGTGALRQGITDYLTQNRSVKSFKFAPPNAGGNGATVVYFK